MSSEHQAIKCNLDNKRIGFLKPHKAGGVGGNFY